jgi:hypothetical protein
MHIAIPARRMAVVAVLTVFGVLMVAAQGAGAAPVPPSDFTCGVIVFDTPCNQTAHFSDVNEVGTPLPSGATNCPAFVTTDFATIVGTGNGIEHSIINNALDGWFTETFTGTVTITAYIGDPALGGVPDPNVLPYTGKYTEWFGGSFNRNNSVFHDTIHFEGTAADGTTLRIFDVSHANTTGAAPFGPPHSFEILSCG